MRNSHRCQLSGLATSSLSVICFVFVCGPVFKRHRRACTVPRPDPVCLPTGRSAAAAAAAYSASVYRRDSVTASRGFRFFFSIFGACLQGAFMSQGESFSSFFVMQPTSLSAAGLWRCDVTVLVFPSL